MKIRQGFVSNSSSSSFVIIGYNISDWDATKDLPKGYPICILYGKEDGLDEGEVIIGVRHTWEDEGIYATEMESVLKDLEKVTAVIGQGRKLQIYYGNRCD